MDKGVSHENRFHRQIHLKKKKNRDWRGLKIFLFVIVFLGFFFFVLEFYGPVNIEVMSSQSVKSDTVPGQA